MTILHIIQNDRRPIVEASLIYDDAAKTAVDLTSCTAKFRMTKQTDKSVVVYSDAVVIPAEHKVRYIWKEGDTATVDSYYGVFEVYWPDGTKQTFPVAKTTLTIEIDESW